MEAALIAPCGINCNICLGYLRKNKPCPGCPECGGVINCHTGICFSCGLEKLKEFLADKRKTRD